MTSFADDLFLFQGFGLSFNDVWGLTFAALRDDFNCGLEANVQAGIMPKSCYQLHLMLA